MCSDPGAGGRGCHRHLGRAGPCHRRHALLHLGTSAGGSSDWPGRRSASGQGQDPRHERILRQTSFPAPRHLTTRPETPPARSCRPAPAGLAPKSRGLLIGSAAGPSRFPADPQFVARSLSWYTWDYSAGGTGARPRAASRRRAVQHGAPRGSSGSSARSGQGSASLTAVSRIRRAEWAADSDIPIGAAAHPAPRAAQAAPKTAPS